MQSQPNLFTREDTFLGICEGLGEDLRINSNLLRLGLAGMLFWNPVAAVGTYFGAGLLVLLSRLLVPNPKVAAAPQPLPEAEPAPEQTQTEPEPVPLAA